MKSIGYIAFAALMAFVAYQLGKAQEGPESTPNVRYVQRYVRIPQKVEVPVERIIHRTDTVSVCLAADATVLADTSTTPAVTYLRGDRLLVERKGRSIYIPYTVGGRTRVDRFDFKPPTFAYGADFSAIIGADYADFGAFVALEFKRWGIGVGYGFTSMAGVTNQGFRLKGEYRLRR